jgi:hypothetical protein
MRHRIIEGKITIKTKLSLMLGLIISGAPLTRAQIDESQNRHGFTVQSAVKAISVETDRSRGQRIMVELRNEIINKGPTPINPSSVDFRFSTRSMEKLEKGCG